MPANPVDPESNGEFHEQIVRFRAGLQFSQDDLFIALPTILERRMRVTDGLRDVLIKAVNAFFSKFGPNFQRGRAGILNSTSANPGQPITDDIFQFLVTRLQLLLDLRVYECKKASIGADVPCEFGELYEDIASLRMLERKGPNDYVINTTWILEIIPEEFLAGGDHRPHVRDTIRLWWRFAIDPALLEGGGTWGETVSLIFSEMHDELRAAAGDRNCFELYLELTTAEAERIAKAIMELPSDEGRLAILHRLGAREAFPLREQPPGAEILNPMDPEFPRHWRNFLARVIRLERMTDQWRRLRFILSARARLCPIGPSIAKSGERYYSAQGTPKKWRGIQEDWLGTLLFWPLFTALLYALVAGGLAGMGVSALWGVGISCGLLLACAGAQPCSYVLGVVPCGAGSVAMGFSFSLASALILGGMARAGMSQGIDALASFGSHSIEDPFSAVTGGVIGLSAPYWREVLKFPALLIVVLVTSMWGSIVLSGWLMAQPRMASPLYKRLARKAAKDRAQLMNMKGKLARLGLALEFSREQYAGRPFVRAAQLVWRLLLAVVLGGGGIGVIFGLTNGLAKVGSAKLYTFSAAFAVIGGTAAAAVVYRRTASFGKAGLFFLFHACLAVALCSLSFGLAGTVSGLIVLSITCGVYNSTFFTASYIAGEWLGGLDYGERLAFWAATLESVGFVVKVLIGVLSPVHHL